MTPIATGPSKRKSEVLEAAYRHALDTGLPDLALRPMAEAVGSSAGVLIYLFGSKEGLVRALLAKAREDELALLAELPTDSGLEQTGLRIWDWLAAPAHRPLLRLWLQSYGRSLLEDGGPWDGFAQATVNDWLQVLAASQSPRRRRSRAGEAERTCVLAVLRGALLDLLATSDEARCTAAVHAGLAALR
jgi:AcrR family transcriptional regulator